MDGRVDGQKTPRSCRDNTITKHLAAAGHTRAHNDRMRPQLLQRLVARGVSKSKTQHVRSVQQLVVIFINCIIGAIICYVFFINLYKFMCACISVLVINQRILIHAKIKFQIMSILNCEQISEFVSTPHVPLGRHSKL